MKTIKRFFAPHSSTSPSDSNKSTNKSSQKREKYFRSNSSSAIIDLSTERERSLKGAGTLHLDTNVHQFRHHSAANSPISYNISYNTTPTTATNSPIDSELFNYRRQNNPLISKQSNLQPINTAIASSSTSNNLPISPTLTSPNTRQNQADEFIQQAIQFHEANELEKATYYFKLAADKDSPLGLFLYGIALRHGWGCKVNPKLAVRFLQKAAESAVSDLHATVAASPSIARHELVLAIYELGVCFRHGWGVPKNKNTAAYYFEIAANLGDPDAQNDLGHCYANGEGVKRDMKKAAKYYRLAAAQGSSMLGNSWIYKKKNDE